ncbi:endonuclease MutS2 [Flavicella sediminum]|uniref:endonuclease MutS2 n=1 Tax=Flavicella sediminum TaxID=2585141 RepID=UPI00111EA9C5|nr:DNA mismatch repair protein MutS [Flavicella sediminum]
MGFISKKTLDDLEFHTILKSVEEHCISDLGRAAVQTISPIANKPDLLIELQQVKEYNASFISENRIPNHHFEDLSKEISLLKIENSTLVAESFLKIATNSETVNELLLFLKKFKEYFPTLYDVSKEIEFTKSAILSIQKIITPYGEVTDNASTYLKDIRREINNVRSKISSSFTREMSRYDSAGYLDDIRESVVDNQRVLAVLAMHRKKVKGSLLGSSKTGSIVFIAPQATLQLHRELQNLHQDEKQEINRLLKVLTEEIRPFFPLFASYQKYLIQLDLVGAKAKYGLSLNALLPAFSNVKKVYFKEAYHPILLEKNKAANLKIIPQTLELNEKQQIIVISGPNAGGKSITLKTIGLLQVMLQSGMLIPVDERSETYFFDNILTDIGDNQSIENQLSTYSYRLKNMRGFLKRCNKHSLFLIDEFGTGSDPELGGALAEIFLEEFYEKKAFGVITTHYSNLKVLANELENVSNANMQFDEKTLEPLFKLHIGQAGSSFTFEVAQKNGIPFSLINRAKKKVEGEKIRLDKTISKLQKERNQLQRNSQALENEQQKAKAQTENLSEKEEKIKDKLNSFQELYDKNQKMLSFGRKSNELLYKYFQTNNKKELLAEFNKWVLIEKTKHLKLNPPVKKNKVQKKKEKEVIKEKTIQLEKIEKEILTQVVEVRKEKIIEAKKIAKEKASYVFKVNDKVRLIDGKACGIIDKIEKNKVTIDYGMFTTKATLDKIELVVAAKRKK